jgi:hypothetical protein
VSRLDLNTKNWYNQPMSKFHDAMPDPDYVAPRSLHSDHPGYDAFGNQLPLPIGHRYVANYFVHGPDSTVDIIHFWTYMLHIKASVDDMRGISLLLAADVKEMKARNLMRWLGVLNEPT